LPEVSTTKASGQPRGFSRLLGNLALAGAALLVSLLVCELVLRLLHVSYPVFVWTDPVRGMAHIPGAKSLNQYAGRSWIQINSDGWRGPEVPLKHPAGTFRIALLGDSYLEGFEVPFEQTAGEVLERRLTALRGSPVEVLNFAEGGYGTGQELLVLQHAVWKYSPDLVLLGFTIGNDISDNLRALKRTDYVPYFVYQGDHLVLDSSFVNSPGYRSRAFWTKRWLGVVQHSRLAQMVNRVRHLRRGVERQRKNTGDPRDEVGLLDEVQLPPTTPDWQEAWRVTEGLLRLMRDECRKKNVPFGFVTLTRGIQVTPVREKKEKFLRQLGVKDLYYPDRRLADFGKREGIPVFNLAPPMAAEAEKRQVYFHADLLTHTVGVGHWNQEGHQIVGELIASWLAGEPRLLPSQPAGAAVR
jgi:hypothetical protein